jgi:hypothetical protein
VTEITRGKKISTFTPEELLGPLNDVEKKFAPQRLYVAGMFNHLCRRRGLCNHWDMPKSDSVRTACRNIVAMNPGQAARSARRTLAYATESIKVMYPVLPSLRKVSLSGISVLVETTLG